MSVTTALPLAAADRCDRCGAQALLRATMPSGLDVLLCNHHGVANEAALAAQGATFDRAVVPA